MTQVVIDDIVPRTQLTATAAQTVFNTNWTADATTDIDVYARASGVEPDDQTQLISPSLYNVTFIGVSETVRVTFLSGRTANDVITIVRNTPAERTNLYINTNFVPSMLNQDFGILTLVDQQNQMYDTRICPRYNVSATIDPVIDVILPILDENQIWAMNSTRTGFIAYDVPSGGGIAPDDATYILQVAHSELPNAQTIASLASGIVIGTTTTGVLLSRILTGTTNQISVANGSGISGNPTISISANPILSGTAGMGIPQGTTAQRVVPISGISLRYNTDLQDVEYWDGAQWVQFADPVGEPLTSTDDTNVTLVLGGSPLTALVNAASLTLGWTGVLSGVRGGTGVNNGASTITLGGSLSTVGAFTASFTMTGNTAVTFPTSGTLATTSQLVTPAALTKTDDTNVTLTLGGSPSTALVNAASLTLGWTGILSKARGGTSVSSATIAPASLEFAAWDTNLNLSANNFLGGFATTATAAGTTTLTVASAYRQEFTGSTTQTVVLPVTSTLVAGHSFQLINNSSGNVTVNSSGGNAVLVMAANTVSFISCVLASGTTAASWNASYLFDLGAGVLSITGTANQVIASASTGNITLSLPQSIATSSAVTFGSLAFSTTSGIIGTTTNDSAAAGSVGEIISSLISFASRIGITTATQTNVTSIALTAGDWDVWGNIGFGGAASTLVEYQWGSISPTSATIQDDSQSASVTYSPAVAVYNVNTVNFCIPQQRISLSGSATYYLVGLTGFSVSTSTVYGGIYARRRR